MVSAKRGAPAGDASEFGDAHDAHRALASGKLHGERLLARLRAVPEQARETWLDRALALPDPPPDEALPRGAVPYLPAGVEEILTVIASVPISATDTFVDIGSGLGRVVLLVHLLTGARAHGIEIQAPLVQLARRTAAKLRLTQVSFERADASDVRLDGTVFFLYSPLTGEALQRLLIALRELSERQAIVVCAVGLSLDHEPWLSPRPRSSAAVTCYDAPPP